MNLEHTTAMTLKVGVVAGLALIIAGLCMSFLGHGDGVLYAGMLLLIVSPFLGIIASAACLAIQRDWYWASVATVLLVITTIGMLLNLV